MGNIGNDRIKQIGRRWWITDWRPCAAAGPWPAGRGWRPESPRRCGGGSRGCGSCGARYSHLQSSIPSWLRSCRREPCRRKPCTCTTSLRCLRERERGRAAWCRQAFTVKDWRLTACVNLVWRCEPDELFFSSHTHTYTHMGVQRSVVIINCRDDIQQPQMMRGWLYDHTHIIYIIHIYINKQSKTELTE